MGTWKTYRQGARRDHASYKWVSGVGKRRNEECTDQLGPMITKLLSTGLLTLAEYALCA
jgi:hypothetical protein